jgi:transcription antitermination factor NusG
MYWAVCRTECGREQFAVKMLAIRGFKETYLPLIKARKTRYQQTGAAPLFKNYLFIGLEDFWWDAAWCPGVAKMLMDGIKPAKVRPGVVEAIRAREDGSGLVVLPKPPDRRFKAGDRVMVIKGPLAGIPGLYAGQSNCTRVRVLLHLLGAPRMTTMLAGEIEAVTSGPPAGDRRGGRE